VIRDAQLLHPLRPSTATIRLTCNGVCFCLLFSKEAEYYFVMLMVQKLIWSLTPKNYQRFGKTHDARVIIGCLNIGHDTIVIEAAVNVARRGYGSILSTRDEEWCATKMSYPGD